MNFEASSLSDVLKGPELVHQCVFTLLEMRKYNSNLNNPVAVMCGVYL